MLNLVENKNIYKCFIWLNGLCQNIYKSFLYTAYKNTFEFLKEILTIHKYEYYAQTDEQKPEQHPHTHLIY